MHSGTAVESGVDKMEHVAQVIFSYVLLLVPSISKHLGLSFILGPGSRYDGMYRDDMAEDVPSSHPTSSSSNSYQQEDKMSGGIKTRLAWI